MRETQKHSGLKRDLITTAVCISAMINGMPACALALFPSICRLIPCANIFEWPDLYWRRIIRLGRAWAKNGSSSDMELYI